MIANTLAHLFINECNIITLQSFMIIVNKLIKMIKSN